MQADLCTWGTAAAEPLLSVCYKGLTCPALYRPERMLSDIVGDAGRAVRLRYCSSGHHAIREEALPVCLDMEEALTLLNAKCAAQHPGTLCSAQYASHQCI